MGFTAVVSNPTTEHIAHANDIPALNHIMQNAKDNNSSSYFVKYYCNNLNYDICSGSFDSKKNYRFSFMFFSTHNEHNNYT